MDQESIMYVQDIILKDPRRGIWKWSFWLELKITDLLIHIYLWQLSNRVRFLSFLKMEIGQWEGQMSKLPEPTCLRSEAGKAFSWRFQEPCSSEFRKSSRAHLWDSAVWDWTQSRWVGCPPASLSAHFQVSSLSGQCSAHGSGRGQPRVS